MYKQGLGAAPRQANICSVKFILVLLIFDRSLRLLHTKIKTTSPVSTCQRQDRFCFFLDPPFALKIFRICFPAKVVRFVVSIFLSSQNPRRRLPLRTDCAHTHNHSTSPPPHHHHHPRPPPQQQAAAGLSRNHRLVYSNRYALSFPAHAHTRPRARAGQHRVSTVSISLSRVSLYSGADET